jgi:hypothetical protein
MSRSLLKKIQLSLLALGLLGGGVIACGDDPAPSNEGTNNGDGDEGDGDEDEGDGDEDEGDGDEGDGDGDIVETECGPVPGFENLEGKACKTSGGGQGFQLCEEGEPSGKCMTPAELLSSFSDAGTVEIPDGGLGEAKDCPEEGFECSEANVLGMKILAGQMTCNVNSGIYSAPPSDSSCTTNGAACTAMGLQGVCITGLPLIGSVCVQQCK